MFCGNTYDSASHLYTPEGSKGKIIATYINRDIVHLVTSKLAAGVVVAAEISDAAWIRF